MGNFLILILSLFAMPVWAETVCEIKIASCPAQPNWNSYFSKATFSYQWMSWVYPTYDDTYNGAATSAEKCLARAEQWHRWCEAPASSPASATFSTISNDGDRLAQASSTFPAANSCEIKLEGTCRSYPTLQSRLIDYYAPGNSSQHACHLRAYDYQAYCGTSATARYYENYRPGPSFTATASGQFTCGPYETFYELEINPDQGKTLTYDYHYHTDAHYATYHTSQSLRRLRSAPGVMNIDFLPGHMSNYGIRNYKLRFCGSFYSMFVTSINSQLQILY